MKLAIGLSLALALGAGGGYLAGRSSAAVPVSAASITGANLTLAQAGAPQGPNDPRELFPLTPGPGQGPGQGQGQQPGQGQGQQPGQCPVYLYQDGRLYQFQQPGQQPGQGGNGPGQNDPSQELFPLQPYNGPSPIPGLPVQPAPPTTRS